MAKGYWKDDERWPDPLRGGDQNPYLGSQNSRLTTNTELINRKSDFSLKKQTSSPPLSPSHLPMNKNSVKSTFYF